MTEEQFAELVRQDSAIAGPIVNASSSLDGRRSVFVETAIIYFMFPIVVFVVKEIGLPWLHEAKRYSELWRLKFGAWVDSQYRSKGLDPEQARLAGEALRKELEAISGKDARKAWEDFAKRVPL